MMLTGQIEMRMKDPIPTFTYLVTKLKEQHPNLAWIHVVEPRVTGHDEREILEGEVRRKAP